MTWRGMPEESLGATMIGVSFEHWQYTFQEAMLSRYESRYFSRKEAGEHYLADIYGRATRLTTLNLNLSESQVLCGNEAFPEAAVADPIADLEVWDEWKAGTRYFPYPGRYSRLGITRQEEKTSSPSSVGVMGEILTGFFAQAGVSPWVVVRVVRRWPDFIFSHRDGTYSFVESKAFTGKASGKHGLRSRTLDGLMINAGVDAAQQLNSNPFGKVWYSFTHVASISPMRLHLTFLEMNVSEERRAASQEQPMPAAVVEGLAERAVNQAAARLNIHRIEDLRGFVLNEKDAAIRTLEGNAEDEIETILPETGERLVRGTDREALSGAIAKIVEGLRNRKGTKAKSEEMGESSGQRFFRAKELAADSRLSKLRRIGDQWVFLADLPQAQQSEVRRSWSPDWTKANRPWNQIDRNDLWRCGGAVFCLGDAALEGREIGGTPPI
jgi:hypothetical protein